MQDLGAVEAVFVQFELERLLISGQCFDMVCLRLVLRALVLFRFVTIWWQTVREPPAGLQLVLGNPAEVTALCSSLLAAYRVLTGWVFSRLPGTPLLCKIWATFNCRCCPVQL